jgi:ferredoxin
MTYLPVIDAAACATHGDCAVVAPDVFRIDEIAVVVGTAPDDVILAAAEACPSVAISVMDSESGETAFP